MCQTGEGVRRNTIINMRTGIIACGQCVSGMVLVNQRVG